MPKRILVAVIIPFLPFVAGCIAFGSEKMAGGGGTIDLSWGSFIIVYGPMAGMLAWFMHREKVRDANEAKREERRADNENRQIEAITLVIAAVAEFRADLQKSRTAVYQLRDETRSKTRIIGGNEE